MTSVRRYQVLHSPQPSPTLILRVRLKLEVEVALAPDGEVARKWVHLPQPLRSTPYLYLLWEAERTLRITKRLVTVSPAKAGQWYTEFWKPTWWGFGVRGLKQLSWSESLPDSKP